jgi:hypothetical protein
VREAEELAQRISGVLVANIDREALGRAKRRTAGEPGRLCQLPRVLHGPYNVLSSCARASGF